MHPKAPAHALRGHQRGTGARWGVPHPPPGAEHTAPDLPSGRWAERGAGGTPPPNVDPPCLATPVAPAVLASRRPRPVFEVPAVLPRASERATPPLTSTYAVIEGNRSMTPPPNRPRRPVQARSPRRYKALRASETPEMGTDRRITPADRTEAHSGSSQGSGGSWRSTSWEIRIRPGSHGSGRDVPRGNTSRGAVSN